MALATNRPLLATPGVRIITHQPASQSANTLSSNSIELRELQTKLARGESVARVLQKLKGDGFIPDVIIAHSGWGEALFVKDVFPTTPLLVYAEYYYGADDGDTHFDPEFSKETLEGLERLRIKNTHLLHSLVACDRGLSPTSFQKNCHPELLRQKIAVIHDGIDTEVFAPNPRAAVSLKSAGIALTSNDEIITFVARELEPYRGYHSFMRALPELMSLRPNARIIIVGGSGVSYGAAPPDGTSWKEIFLNEVSGNIDHRRIHFVGKLPHQLLTQLFQVSAVHVYLTYPFVLSWSLLEAMSIGCLIVASRTKPVEEVIDHERTGFFVDFFNPSEIARKVADVAKNRKALASMRNAARAHVVEHFDLYSYCLPAQIRLLQSMA